MDGPKKLRAIRDLGILPDSASVCAADLLLAGFDPSKEPYLRSCVSRLVEDSLKKLAEGRVAIPGSVLLKGVPDPTSTLAEGEICVMQHGACAAAQELSLSNVACPKLSPTTDAQSRRRSQSDQGCHWEQQRMRQPHPC